MRAGFRIPQRLLVQLADGALYLASANRSATIFASARGSSASRPRLFATLRRVCRAGLISRSASTVGVAPLSASDPMLLFTNVSLQTF